MSDPAPDRQGNWRVLSPKLLSVGAHTLLFAVSLLVAFALRYDFRLTDPWFVQQYLPYLGLTLVVKLVIFGWMGLYRDSWRYVGLRDLFTIIKASHYSVFICVIIYFIAYSLWQVYGPPERELVFWIPNSVFLLDWVLTISCVSTARVGFRFYHEELRPLGSSVQRRLLIVGAGDCGDTVLREISRTSEDRYLVIGFLDDDPRKRGGRIRGIEILGGTADIRRICEKHNIDEVLFADPALPQRDVRKLIETCHGMNLRFQTVPSFADLIEGRVQVSQIRPVDIEDLLGREPVKLDTEAIGNYIRGRVIMVTGAGGSIGSEMCRQIARFKPKLLLMVERMENALFEIDRALQREFPDLARRPLVADIADRERVRHILATERPTAIFHAAAHKHVPMMEWNPGEAVKNNVVGTRVLADCTQEAGVAKFVMISTDKAVNPTSVMGCTKRVAEMYVQQLASHSGGRTDFVTVRFGNVLGSSGSVIPIFKDQIARGGPVTVTHEEMTRYFMTIPEASQLVLQAGAMGVGGEIFLLDMGEPVKIKDLAIDLITLSGLRPGIDIDIVYTGMRPGEKLFEELSIDGENVSRTAHPKIGITRKRPEDFARVCAGIQRLVDIVDTGTSEEIRQELRRVVPEYTPTGPGQPATAASSPAGSVAVFPVPSETRPVIPPQPA